MLPDPSAPGTSPDRPVHHPCHWARSQIAPDPFANIRMDTRPPLLGANAKPPDSALAAHSGSTAHMRRRNPVLRSTECRASADLPSWREQIPPASAADRGPHSSKSVRQCSRSPAVPRSRKFAHDRCGAVPLARAPDGRDNGRARYLKSYSRIGSQRHSSASGDCFCVRQWSAGRPGPATRLLDGGRRPSPHAESLLQCVLRNTACMPEYAGPREALRKSRPINAAHWPLSCFIKADCASRRGGDNMTTTRKSGDQEPTQQATHNIISGTTVSSSSGSLQKKLAVTTIASFTILGLLLATSACSSQSSKPALVSVTSPASGTATPATPHTAESTPAKAAVATTAAAKRTPRKRPTKVTYNDANFGVSFLYPDR